MSSSFFSFFFFFDKREVGIYLPGWANQNVKYKSCLKQLCLPLESISMRLIFDSELVQQMIRAERGLDYK